MRYSYAAGAILDHYPHLKPAGVVQRLRDHTYVSVSRRYLYFQVPKVATTAMKTMLHEAENSPPMKFFATNEWITRRDKFIHDRTNVPLPSLADLDDARQKEVLESPDFLRMTIVRNPYDRLVSAWRGNVRLCEPDSAHIYFAIRGKLPDLGKKSLISLEEFVDYVGQECDVSTCNGHWRRQTDHHFFKAMNFSHVGKVECLPETLQRFQQHLGAGAPMRVNSRNVSRSGSVALTEALAAKIHSLYRADFETFAYDKNEWATSQDNSERSQKNSMVPEEIFDDEIVERNVILYHLYQERDRLRSRTLFGVCRLLYRKFQDRLSVPLLNAEQAAFKWSHNKRIVQ